MTPQFAGWITACVAHYRCHGYIRRAVESLLHQSYPWIRVVVINDGDPIPPWRELAPLTDSRILKFNLKNNYGCFFCWEVVRRATLDSYFMMQDADDWAAPGRAATLLNDLLENKSDLAVSAQPQFCESDDGTPYQVSIRWSRAENDETQSRFVLQHSITDEFSYRAPHHGLVRLSALDRIGGYYGGFRIGWDVLLTNLILMTGSISWTPEPLYYRLVRSDSLTHSSQTGAQTEYAAAVSRCLQKIYKDCYAQYRLRVRGRIDRARLCAAIRHISGRYVSSEDRRSLELHASQLRRMMA